jgi:hypothetical protein
MLNSGKKFRALHDKKGRSLRSLELLHVKDEHRNAQLNIVSRGLVKTARGDNNHRTK